MRWKFLDRLSDCKLLKKELVFIHFFMITLCGKGVENVKLQCWKLCKTFCSPCTNATYLEVPNKFMPFPFIKYWSSRLFSLNLPSVSVWRQLFDTVGRLPNYVSERRFSNKYGIHSVNICTVSSGGASYKAHLGYAGLSIKHITSETVVRKRGRIVCEQYRVHLSFGLVSGPDT